MKPDQMSPEERAEYDELMASLYVGGESPPSSEIGALLHEALLDALQAGRTWAGYVLDDDALVGHRHRWIAWRDRQRTIKVFHNGRLVPKAATRGVIVEQTESGSVHQGVMWEEMTWAQIEAERREALTVVAAHRSTVTLANRLLELRDRCPGSLTPRDAADRLGISLEAFLAEGAA